MTWDLDWSSLSLSLCIWYLIAPAIKKSILFPLNYLLHLCWKSAVHVYTKFWILLFSFNISVDSIVHTGKVKNVKVGRAQYRKLTSCPSRKCPLLCPPLLPLFLLTFSVGLCVIYLFPISFVEWPLTSLQTISSAIEAFGSTWFWTRTSSHFRIGFPIVIQRINQPDFGLQLIIECVRLREPQVIRTGKTHGQGPRPRGTSWCAQGSPRSDGKLVAMLGGD